MKTAKTAAAAVYVDCPNCGENFEHPVTGSFLWELNSPVSERELTCLACGEKAKTPPRLLRKRDGIL
jgi:uncharacterized Zn finger protein